MLHASFSKLTLEHVSLLAHTHVHVHAHVGLSPPGCGLGLGLLLLRKPVAAQPHMEITTIYIKRIQQFTSLQLSLPPTCCLLREAVSEMMRSASSLVMVLTVLALPRCETP